MSHGAIVIESLYEGNPLFELFMRPLYRAGSGYRYNDPKEPIIAGPAFLLRPQVRIGRFMPDRPDVMNAVDMTSPEDLAAVIAVADAD